MSVEGLILRPARAGYAQVLDRLRAAFASRGIVPMAVIDHAAAAAQVGLSMSPLVLFVFGDPRAGTGLMTVHPTLGIDLPLKLIVWEDAAGVHVAYNDPAWLAERHGADHGSPVLERMRHLLEALASEAAA